MGDDEEGGELGGQGYEGNCLGVRGTSGRANDKRANRMIEMTTFLVYCDYVLLPNAVSE